MTIVLFGKRETLFSQVTICPISIIKLIP